MRELVLVRHGETAGESSVRLNGITDVALDAVGRRQMGHVADFLRDESFDTVATSPLVRCREAAALIRPDEELQVLDGLREIDFGRWESWTHSEAQARDPETYERWRSEGAAFRFPGGESRAGFARRVIAAAKPLIQSEGRTLAVLHKGVITVLLGHLLGIPADRRNVFPVDLAGIHRLAAAGTGWQMKLANYTSHLGGDLVRDRAVNPDG